MALEVFRARPDVIHVPLWTQWKPACAPAESNLTPAFSAMFHGHDVRLEQKEGLPLYGLICNSGSDSCKFAAYPQKPLDQGVEPQKTRVHSVGIELSKFLFLFRIAKTRKSVFSDFDGISASRRQGGDGCNIRRESIGFQFPLRDDRV